MMFLFFSVFSVGRSAFVRLFGVFIFRAKIIVLFVFCLSVFDLFVFNSLFVNYG